MMSREKGQLLAINVGSSSVRFALYETDFNSQPITIYSGKISGIGALQGSFTLTLANGEASDEKIIRPVSAPDALAAVVLLMDWILKGFDHKNLVAIGHRIVHGGPAYQEPQKISDEMLLALNTLWNLDPKHLPAEIFFAQQFIKQFPDLPQVACFDTTFHQHLPKVAQLLAIPHRYAEQGIKRYGFHGLSCEYLLDALAHAENKSAAQGRVIIAHLGSGASLTAVHDGNSKDTSMGFTPTSGLPMSSRTGDIDPGLVWQLASTEQMTAEQFQHMVNYESGLLGVSGISSDISLLLLREAQDVRAADAIALFCYQTKKWIGALTAALEGLDTVIFSGGIGENQPEIRARICMGLEFLGVELDPAKNSVNAAIISTQESRVVVRVIPTDEESVIARHTLRVLAR
jgi:acetate kinase